MDDEDYVRCFECGFEIEPGEESDRDPEICAHCAAILHEYELN